ncbi:hypothetical protein [Christiangramia fulva]|uniref:hypothetical protein n=1 Tax=Christiangramia fulva TaxID=2126553 RepID=UPI00131BBB9A|nr:hypothetical protein [Christiangramia fulva]
MKTSKKIAVGVLITLGILALALLILNNIAESKIKKSLEDNLKRARVDYKKVDVKLLARNAEIINPQFHFKNKSIKADTVELKDIHLWEYITHKNLIIDKVDISNPVIKIYPASTSQKTDSSSAGKSKFKNHILLKDLAIQNAVLTIFQKDTSSAKFHTRLTEVRMKDIDVNKTTAKKTIPFSYNLTLLKSDTLFLNLGKRHTLQLASLAIEDSSLVVRDFRIIPKYDKEEFQQHLQTEKDRYDLVIDSIILNDLDWKYENSKFEIKDRLTRIAGVDFKIYRDKLQPDDTTFKPMYSQMIRNLPIKLGMDSVVVRRMYLQYQEKLQNATQPGELQFSNMNAEMANITNIGLQRKDFPKTHIDVRTDFMKTAPVDVDWDFDISDKQDHFQISGSMGRLKAEQINEFLKPAMNVVASGEILDMYFNFYGDDENANGDMRLEYKNFKVKVLQKKSRNKKEIISGLANLLVNNKALNKEANYKDISVKRDKTRSFWNYFWKCIRSGALKQFL